MLPGAITRRQIGGFTWLSEILTLNALVVFEAGTFGVFVRAIVDRFLDDSGYKHMTK
jgi:hypothetical protein